MEIKLPFSGSRELLTLNLCWWDYVVATILLLLCFFAFFHIDILWIGQDAASVLWGDLLDFYDNAAAIRGPYQNYPALVYWMLGLWMLPLKVLGFLATPAQFSPLMVYWVKVFTSIIYVLMCLVFYRVSGFYSENKEWRKYATALCAVAPMALFSQFFFTQVDVFYVFLSLLGFEFFLKGSVFRAAAAFGFAVAFKYFPVFVFFPLLLLFEKRVLRIVFAVGIFAIPSALIHVAYRNSEAFAKGVIGFNVLEKLFNFQFPVAGYCVYPLVALFVGFCALVFLVKPGEFKIRHVAAYVFAAGAVCPFVIIAPHPQWLLLSAPAMTLVLLLSPWRAWFLWLDIAGAATFFLYAWIYYPGGTDVGMVRLSHLGWATPENAISLGEWLRSLGRVLFLGTGIAFRLYLIVFLAVGLSVLVVPKIRESVNYWHVRCRFLSVFFLYALPVLGLWLFDVLHAG